MAQRKKTDINRTAVSSTRHLQSKGGNTYGQIKGILAREADIWNWKEMIIWQVEMEEGLAGGQN